MPKFVPRQRKHRVLARQKVNAGSIAHDGNSNAFELMPVSKEEKEARRQQLKAELKGQQTKLSGKKKKRLDKYIVC